MRTNLLAATVIGGLALFSVAPALAQQAQPADPAKAGEDQVVARVNGSEIRLQDLYMAIESLPQQYRSAPLPMIYGPLLQQLAERRVVAQAAEKEGLLNDPEVQRRLAMARELILERVYLTRKVEDQIDPEKLRARYEADLKSKPAPEEVRARHILLETREDAEAALKEVKGGADFAETAKKLSKGPSGPNGGDLGFFGAGEMVPEFSEAAFAMAPGEVSEPVQTQFGWHIIKVEERRKGTPAAFEKRQDELRDEVAREVIQGTLKSLGEAATIEAFNPDGTPREAPKIGQRGE